MIRIDIISTIATYVSAVFSISFISTLLITSIITGILARILGSLDVFGGFKAGAISQLVIAIIVVPILAIIGFSSPWVFLAIIYLVPALFINYITGLDIVRSIAVAIAAKYLASIMVAFIL